MFYLFCVGSEFPLARSPYLDNIQIIYDCLIDKTGYYITDADGVPDYINDFIGE